MNKSLKYLLFTALTVSVANISASDYTAKTYLSRRPVNVNLPMELTTFNERMQAKSEHFGGNMQISGFYGQTNGGDDVGAYFGINNKSTYQLTQSPLANAASTQDFDLAYLLHDFTSAELGSITNVSLSPKSTQYGARFDYYGNLDRMLKGLYVKVNTTVVSVKNDMDLDVKTTKGGTFPDGSAGESATLIQTQVQGFFAGTFDWSAIQYGNTSDDLQAKLEKGLMTGEHTETGLADIDVILGYKFLEKAKYHAGINLGVTIPTGKKPSGRYLFEPVYGNHSHVGFGGGLDAHVNLWTKGKQDIKLNFVANYRYIFEASEFRPLGLKGYASPYVLLGIKGITAASTGIELVPAANILTPLGVKVTPGSQFDGVLAFAYNNGGLSADLGYNVYAREGEDVKVKGTLTATTYGVAARNFRTATQFGISNLNFDNGGTTVTPVNPANWLTNANINVDAAATPSQFTNGIYGGLGYQFKKWEYPALIGIGGKYDWASKNSEFDSWSVWIKLARSF